MHAHVLNWLHGTVGLTWAWSIVALTVIVRMLLVPLTVKQIHSMQNLQRYAPQMKEIQKKYKQRQAEAERRADEVLPGEPDQPGCVVPADARRSSRSSSRSTTRCGTSRSSPPRPGPLVAPLHPVDRGADDGPLGRLRAARRLRREPDGVDALHVGDRRQDAAHALHAHAARLRVRDRALPGGPRSLLGDDEPLDGRPGTDHAAARAEDAGADRREEELADAAERRRRERQRRAARAPDRRSRAGSASQRAAQGAPEEEGRGRR